MNKYQNLDIKTFIFVSVMSDSQTIGTIVPTDLSGNTHQLLSVFPRRRGLFEKKKQRPFSIGPLPG